MKRRLSEHEISELFIAARAGDRSAWSRMVEVFNPLIWAVCRSHGLSHQDSCDVGQLTWLRLVESMDRLTQPGRVAAWLATTARRECLRVLRTADRITLVEDATEVPHSVVPYQASVDSRVLADEESAEVAIAFSRCSPRCQVLLSLLTTDPALSYQEISGILEMPIGSIGPTRQRCLDCLRRILDSTPEE